MIMYDRKKIIAQMSQSSVFNGADLECWHIRTVYFTPADTRIVSVICRKPLRKFQQYVLHYKSAIWCQKSQCDLHAILLWLSITGPSFQKFANKTET